MELDDEKIRVVVSEAVLQSLDETGRNALIQCRLLPFELARCIFVPGNLLAARLEPVVEHA